MSLVFEISKNGRGNDYLPDFDVPEVKIEDAFKRECVCRLPEVAESDLQRHYTKLAKKAHGVNDGFYPLGSCTMKYNPKINEVTAGLAGFSEVHPLQPLDTVMGSIEALSLAEEVFAEITGMDAMSFQPAAGAHGEFCGILLMKAYHHFRNEKRRTKILVPDSAHGTNPASANMCGYTIVNIPSTADGCVDVEKLKEAVGDDTAGLMLTNPNTLGIFDKNILEITKIVHDAGGVNYYDGANLNAVMGVARPGDMGFDIVHLNLHKTFSTPHGGGGPGSGPVGCKDFLSAFLPNNIVTDNQVIQSAHSMGRVKSNYGNVAVTLKALTYVLALGKEGIKEAAIQAVLNANYMKAKLSDTFDMATEGICMHEFVMSLESFKKEYGVSAMDVAKALLDYEIHPPTMYFPLTVHEALMIEPTETESKETLDHAISVFKEIAQKAKVDAQYIQNTPTTTPISRPDEVKAAREPIVRFQFNHD